MKEYFDQLVYILAVLFLATSVSFAQQSAQSNQGQNNCQMDAQQLKALVEEVRQMRQELRKVTNNTHRLLVLSDLYARQQSRVEGLVHEIDQLNSQLKNVEDTSKDEEAVKEIEAALNNEIDTQARVQLVQVHAIFKSSLEKQKKQAEEFAANSRDKLQRMEAKLQEEREKLSSMKEEMERLNLELDKPAVGHQKGK